MFRPIKNFITYIRQKKSSGGIGTNAIGVEAAQELKEETGSRVVMEAEDVALIKPTMTKVVVEAEEEEEEQSQLSPKPVTNEDDDQDEGEGDDKDTAADFDIEMQIKSSVMLKSSTVMAAPELLQQVVGAEGVAVAVVIAPVVERRLSAAIAVEAEEDDDAQSDCEDDTMGDNALAEAPTTQRADVFYAVDSTEPVAAASEEEDEEHFLEFAQDIEAFPGSEVIVISDVDVNSSLASDAPSEDPLAIDDYTQPAVGVVETSASNTLDSSTCSSTAEEAPALAPTCDVGSDKLWLIDDIKASTSTPNDTPQQQQKVDDITPLKRVVVAADSHKSAKPSEETAEELRSEGSDSGLGGETSTLLGLTDTSTAGGMPKQRPIVVAATVVPTALPSPTVVAKPPLALMPPKPLRSNLKRRLEPDDDDVLGAATDGIGVAISPSVAVPHSQQKKPKRSINFDSVEVYYFPRQQGFGCVPSAGGCTLGMAATHNASRMLTLAEHAAELRRAHRLQLQEINPRSSSSDDSEESEEDYMSEGSGSDADAETNGFLQPVSPKQRRALLKAAGVRKIDAGEKAECRDIRNSREVCGCTCRDFCDPETCACSQAGIKCQVDRSMFPCGCSRDACGNPLGRVEFNPQRVRIHFIHTIMRLEMENRHQQTPSVGAAIAYGTTTASTAQQQITVATSPAAGTGSYYGGLQQPHSNYSSGYASPVYPGETTPAAANYYQSQQQAPPPHYASLAPLQLTPSAFQLDTLDSGIYAATAAAATAASASSGFSDLVLPSYGNVTTAATATTPNSGVYHHHSLSGYTSGALQPTAYSSYHLAAHSGIGGAETLPPPMTYSSCAVPSVPPFGAATTTAAAAHYHTDCGVVLETTTAPSCMALNDGGGGGVTAVGSGSFIDLNTPIASSTRLSQQINELLQHNRHSHAALVATTALSSQQVSTSVPLTRAPVSMLNLSADSCTSSCSASASIQTPPIVEESLLAPLTLPPHKSCLSFAELAAAPLSPPCVANALHATPIASVPEGKTCTTALERSGYAVTSTRPTATTTSTASSLATATTTTTTALALPTMATND